jgi:hypothetical protein
VVVLSHLNNFTLSVFNSIGFNSLMVACALFGLTNRNYPLLLFLAPRKSYYFRLSIVKLLINFLSCRHHSYVLIVKSCLRSTCVRKFVFGMVGVLRLLD